MSYSFDLNESFSGFSPPVPPDGCTQCGICLPSCPTFVKSQDPEQSPMGRIRLMRTLKNDNSEGMTPEKIEKLESCLGCYSCELVCPSKVNFGKMLDETLAQLLKQRPLSLIARMMLWLATRTSIIRSIIRVTYITQITGLRTLVAKLGLLRFVGMQRANALLGKVNYPTTLTNHVKHSSADQQVALFTGCFSSVLEQTCQQATIDVFNAISIEVTLPAGQGCCGALHRHNGELITAEKLARNNIKAFSENKTNIIVTTSSGCGSSLNDYGEWLDDEELIAPVMSVTNYLSSTLKQYKLAFETLSLKIALHTPCTLRQSAGEEEAVIDLLQTIPGLEIIPLSGEPRCCGAGGSHMLSHTDMADALRYDIIEEIKSIDVDVLISSNLGCAMHIREGLVQAGIDIPLQHPVQLIAQAIVPRTKT